MAKSILHNPVIISAIDVLRGIAALGVAWFHSRVDLWVGFREIRANPDEYSALDRWLSMLSLPVSQLGSLVMLFFVLSGFCIHLPLAGKGRSPDLASYAIRRGFRIYPAYFATLVFCYLSAMILSLSLGTASGTGSESTKYVTSALMLKIGGIFWIEVFQSKPGSFLVPSLATLLVIPLAWVFSRLFEYPSHELGRTIAKRIQKVPNKESAMP